MTFIEELNPINIYWTVFLGNRVVVNERSYPFLVFGFFPLFASFNEHKYLHTHTKHKAYLLLSPGKFIIHSQTYTEHGGWITINN